MSRIKRIEIIDPLYEQYEDDINRIAAAFQLEGYDVSPQEAFELWKMYSQHEKDAQWASVPKGADVTIIRMLRNYFRDA